MNTNTVLQRAGCFFVLTALGLGIFFFGIDYPKQAALNGRDGRTTQGIVTALRTEVSGRYTGYVGDITFQDEQGRPHQFTAYYPAAVWYSLSVRQPTTVHYLASNPDYAMDPRSYKAQRNPLTFLFISGSLFVLGLVLFAIGRSMHR